MGTASLDNYRTTISKGEKSTSDYRSQPNIQTQNSTDQTPNRSKRRQGKPPLAKDQLKLINNRKSTNESAN